MSTYYVTMIICTKDILKFLNLAITTWAQWWGYGYRL